MVHVKIIGRYSSGLQKHIKKYAIIYPLFFLNMLFIVLSGLSVCTLWTEVLKSTTNIYNKYCMGVLSNARQIVKCTKSSTSVASIQEILHGIFYFHLLSLNNYAFTVSVVNSIQRGGVFWSSTSIISQTYRKKWQVEISSQTLSRTSKCPNFPFCKDLQMSIIFYTLCRFPCRYLSFLQTGT